MSEHARRQMCGGRPGTCTARPNYSDPSRRSHYSLVAFAVHSVGFLNLLLQKASRLLHLQPKSQHTSFASRWRLLQSIFSTCRWSSSKTSSLQLYRSAVSKEHFAYD